MTDKSERLHQGLCNLSEGSIPADSIRDIAAYAVDKIEGLDSDLRNAVQTAYNRGAKEWAVKNYPKWAEWLKSQDTTP